MKKLFGFLVGLIVLLVAAVLVGPNFVNWNDYKGEISQQVRELTGRELTIGGDIRIAVLPAPALVATDISFADLAGASSKNMVTLKSAEVRVALGPLVRGQVKVETVKLIEPVIHLERLADGRVNWQFAGLAAGGAKAATAASGSGEKSAAAAPPPAVAIDDLKIENATLVYRDAVSGINERVEKLSARIAAASIQGPLESNGSAEYMGVPLTFAVNVGRIIHDRTVPVSVQLGSSAGNLDIRAGGTLVSLTTEPKFKGELKLAAAAMSPIFKKLRVSVPAEIAGQPIGIQGKVTATQKDIEIQKLTLSHGDIRASGDLRVETGDTIRLNSRLAIKQIDVDRLLSGTGASPVAKSSLSAPAEAKVKLPMVAAKAKTPLRFGLPANVEGSLILSIDAVSYAAGVVKDVLINADLVNGELTISEASAQLPGGTDLAISARLQTPKKVPTFAADIESTVSDMREVLSWLSIDIPQVSGDRLRKMSFRTQLSGTPSEIRIADLDIRFDSSRLVGGVTVAVRDRPAFGANLILDRLDLDAYLPKSKPARKSPSQKNAAPGGVAAKGSEKAKASGSVPNPFQALSVLTKFDANLSTHIKTLVHGGNQIKDIVSDVTLYNGDLDIRRMSVGKLAGATASIKGKLKGLAGVPTMHALNFRFGARDIGRLARMAGVALPIDPRKIGAVDAKGRLDGSLLRPNVDTTVSAAGAKIGVRGRVSVLPISDMLDARVSVRHKDAARLIRRFGVDYRPSGKLGGLNFDGDVKVSAARLSISNMQAALGKMSVRGKTDVILSGAKPKVVANLAASAIVVDSLLPAKRRAGLDGGEWKIQSASWKPTSAFDIRRLLHQIATRQRGQWSKAPIDLSALHGFDADITLKSPGIKFQKYLFENASIAANLQAGVFSTRQLSGNIFGGTVNAAMQLTASNRNRIEGNGTIAGIDVERALRAVVGEPLANGKMSFDFNLITGGRSVADFIGALGGNGRLALTDVDVRKAGKGSMLSGLFGLLNTFNRLGGGKGSDRADLTGSFNINQGRAHTADTKLTSSYGNGVAAGTVDLARWTIDMEGQVQLAQNLLTKLLRAKIRETKKAVPFSIKGRLDAPNVKVDTGALLGAGVPIPGADILLNKAPKGVGTILRGILGGGRSSQPQAQPSSPPPPSSGGQPAPADRPPPPPSQQQQQQAPSLKPEDLLKKLFKL